MSKHIWDLWQQSVIALADNFVAAVNHAMYNFIPYFAHVSSVYLYSHLWKAFMVIGNYCLGLLCWYWMFHCSTDGMTYVSSLSRRNNCILFYKRICCPHIKGYVITAQSKKIIAIFIIKPTMNVFWWHCLKNKADVFSVNLYTAFKSSVIQSSKQFGVNQVDLITFWIKRHFCIDSPPTHKFRR